MKFSLQLPSTAGRDDRSAAPALEPCGRRLMAIRAKLTVPALLAVLLAAATVIPATATGRVGENVIRFTVPVSAVHAHATKVAPKGMSPGDGFQESYRPTHPGAVIHQDAIAVATFDGGIFLGTITLKHGELVYAGSTQDQDNTTYAIVGGTRSYQDARGTVTTHTISRTRVQITIMTTPQ